jgi:hypothetical protein
MDVDRDGTPQHLKRKRQSSGKWVVVITIGVVFSGLSIYISDHKLSFSPEPSIAQVLPSKSYKPKYEFIEPTGYPATTPKQVFWDYVKERYRQQAQPKRTICNDTNYVPRNTTILSTWKLYFNNLLPFEKHY